MLPSISDKRDAKSKVQFNLIPEMSNEILNEKCYSFSTRNFNSLKLNLLRQTKHLREIDKQKDRERGTEKEREREKERKDGQKDKDKTDPSYSMWEG